ncbi:MAG TPA: DUF1223 domain-containing protein [Aromatoleum sp.]|uniref:DUF1223 domain-containing protein n=1 Tax=Aromatoleum sp. TaxID=2307007 RepID=UPI002B49373B|nr:DUF1223 domain-containing protein [Aromatoleum sp.]HJV24174.1 DUF1223 domain-containing protein [Aromatoleum sp.]
MDMKNALSTMLGKGLLGLLGPLSMVPISAPAAGPIMCEARSPEHTVALLELFTSEGCSSCPPADRWLSGLKGTGATLVPLALHVDYWDYIGWKDVFAQPGFAARQEQQAHAGNTPVYTPQFFVQGRPYRLPSSADGFGRDIAAIAQKPAGADISLFLGQVADGKLSFKFTARLRQTQADAPAGVFVALYENGLTTSVKAGENRGATLHHDFVVREWIGPIAIPAGGSTERAMSFSLPLDRPSANFGVAAFVQNARTFDVMQALSRQVCA